MSPSAGGLGPCRPDNHSHLQSTNFDQCYSAEWTIKNVLPEDEIGGISFGGADEINLLPELPEPPSQLSDSRESL